MLLSLSSLMEVLESSEIQLSIEAPNASTLSSQNKQQDEFDLSGIVEERIKLCSKSILTGFHAGYFRISLSLGGQALLLKTLINPSNPDPSPLRRILQHALHPLGFLILWSLSLFVLVSLSFLYLLRCLFCFNKVKSEFLHHVGVNYLFAPWISWLLLLQSAPFVTARSFPYLVLWWVFVVPVVALDVKIYGQWFTKGKRFLTTVANPTSQLSVIGNLVGAQAAANMGWKESAVCLFSLGMVHYLVLFVTLYQRLSGGDRLPVILRPVLFLFIAVPSVASLAWESIAGSFDTLSKMLFFLSLFFFTSLVCRPMLFKRSMRKFTVAWWSYSFPLTILANAAAEYEREVKGGVPRALMRLLTGISVVVSLGLAGFTLLNSKMLLPDNDPVVNTLGPHLPISAD